VSLKSGSHKVVVTALVGNFTITLIKFAVALISLSSAMLAEAIHSLADTGNQLFLLVGIKRSQKPPDELHPFGYGPEQYFWSFVVAIMLFFIGAIVSLYEGIHKIQHPQTIEKAWLVYLILGISFLLDGYALMVAWREFNRTRNQNEGIFLSVRRSKDTNVVVCLLEDSAALVGLTLAFLGVVISEITGIAAFDAVGSMAIGLLLAAVAFVLAREVKDLLIGEAASPANRKAIYDTINKFPKVQAVGQVLTMHLAPRKILVTMDVEFADGLSTDEIEDVIDGLEDAIKKRVPAVDRIFIEAEKVLGANRMVIRPAKSKTSS